MNRLEHELSADDWDELNFPREAEQDFDRVVERAISRRGFLGGVLAFGSGAAVMGTSALKASAAAIMPSGRFAFEQIPTYRDATVHVPSGYNWQSMLSWGDALFSDAPKFDAKAGIPDEGSDRVFGENTDGMELFNIGGREILAVNSEYVNTKINLPQNEDGMPTSARNVRRLQNFQGVTIVELAEGENGWSAVVDSPFNRRITHNTEMKIEGPAAGDPLLRTADDPTGVNALGTFNNCGSGRTPWGTYLTCEENFNSYFGATKEATYDAQTSAGYQRYGIKTKPGKGRYDYHGFDSRFDISENPNEPHRAGYIVEIDPSDPTSTPVKRTALGRFKHENAACTVAASGHVVVYLGDDERGEFIYKFVSRDVYVPGGDTSSLLNDGQLYVAKFNDDLTGEWLALTPEATGMGIAEIAIFTRMAASKVGATTMDRPEWVAVNATTDEVYCCLTNNSKRGHDKDGNLRTNAGGEAMAVNAVNPRETNRYGQIVRWKPEVNDHTTATFTWDLYVMAGNPNVHPSGPYAGTKNINAGNLFNSPDGMIVDTAGMLWIQTDGNDSDEGEYAGMGNNQMLVGDPETGEIRRFLTGPKGSEITGLCWSSDRRTAFVGVQHPGGHFPGEEGSLPRSTIVAVKRDDNAVIG